MTVRTEHATYSDADATVRAPGPVEYMRGHMTGHGVGMTWDKNRDVMSILDQAVINITPDEHGEGAMDVTARSAEFARRDKYMRFDRRRQDPARRAEHRGADRRSRI